MPVAGRAVRTEEGQMHANGWLLIHACSGGEGLGRHLIAVPILCAMLGLSLLAGTGDQVGAGVFHSG